MKLLMPLFIKKFDQKVKAHGKVNLKEMYKALIQIFKPNIFP